MCRLLLARFESSLHLVGNMLQAAFARRRYCVTVLRISVSALASVFSTSA